MFRFYKKKGWNNEITSFDVTIVSEVNPLTTYLLPSALTG